MMNEERKMVRWVETKTVRWFENKTVRLFGGSAVRWFETKTVRWFEGSRTRTVRQFDSSRVRWYQDTRRERAPTYSNKTIPFAVILAIVAFSCAASVSEYTWGSRPEMSRQRRTSS